MLEKGASSLGSLSIRQRSHSTAREPEMIEKSERFGTPTRSVASERNGRRSLAGKKDWSG
jgi:hypothetical protein